MTWLKGHWQLLLLTAIVFALWQTPIVLPLKILVVFLHELSHGLAALLTGGQIESLSVNPNQGGLTTTRGGSRFLILTAGYLGSLILGLLVLILALRTHSDRALLGLFGLLMLAIAALNVRDLFAFAFTIGTGLLMLAAARFLPIAACDLILRVIGLSSLIYVPYDIFDDTIARSSLRSDARMLAEEFGGGTMLWGGIWMILSVVVIFACLRWGLGADSNLSLGKPRPSP